MKTGTGWPYEDIVNLPHHVSGKHAPMPLDKRAAQFAPFAALTGYEDAISETARLTDELIFLPEEAADELGRKIAEAMEQRTEIVIRYFVPDSKKAGGQYVEAAGKVKKAELGQVTLENGPTIDMGLIVEVKEQ